ncbi:MAG: SGNH/GDSL hydrolase family protein [Proteobacteria bacterium]|nr:SGNH/GDSL hydrolase family protein [Pseudomonadota bacterium]
MSLLLAGLTVLMIGDSHLTAPGFLITSLHDDLMQQGAKVYTYGACGTPSGAWMQSIQPPCGSAFRLADGPLRVRASEAGFTKPLPELVKAYHPNLIVVVNGDTMAAYKNATLPKPWIRDQIKTLTDGIKASGASCIWVGPGWGTEGGKYGKNFARVREMSDYLADIVAPCIYINSLKMSKPGEWNTIPGDGQHYTDEGYLSWGNAITREIVSSDILQKIRH